MSESSFKIPPGAIAAAVARELAAAPREEQGGELAESDGVSPASPASPCCVFCGNEVDVRSAYQRAVGWARRRRAGGVNQIVLREALDEWACWGCVERERAGIAARQERLSA